MTIKPKPAQWHGGYNDECAWIQFGTNTVSIASLVRRWDTSSIEIGILIVDPTATKLDIPGYAPFSIEAGINESIAAIDGIGVLEQRSEKVAVFGTGNMNFDDPYSLFVMRQWLAVAKPPLAIHIGQLSLTLPVDPSVFHALSTLAAKQRYFRDSVRSNAFYVQDKT